MMLITFHIGQERYATQVDSIIEIIPMVNMEKIPLTEKYVKGIFNYRGDPAPVLDLCLLYAGVPCEERMSTRILVINFKDKNNNLHILGLIAEKVTESLNMEIEEFKTSGINVENAPFLCGVANDEKGLIQLVDTSKILPAHIVDTLFSQTSDSLAG